MVREIPRVLAVRDDARAQVPVVFDSPHSGVHYPPDFRAVAPLAVLQTNADLYVDDLYGAAPAHGAGLLAATFSRNYIDANRSLEDIDEALLDGPWPGPVNPSVKTRLGRGLIRRFAAAEVPVYDRKLGVDEVQARIAGYYAPYHQALRQMLDERHARFGAVWHIDCHSMPPVGRPLHEDAGQPRPDVALGDRDGSTCSAGFTDLVRSVLSDLGYQVSVNVPYKGQELVRRYSDPGAGRHSLQIELNRKFYLDDRTLEPGPGYEKLKADLTVLIQAVCAYAAGQVGRG